MAGWKSVASAAAPKFSVDRAITEYARRVAGRMEAGAKPPQPTANVGQMIGDAASVEEADQRVQAGMQGLFDHARVFAPRGGTKGDGFKVQGVQTVSSPDPGFAPTDATMYSVTPESFLRGQYGDDADKVIESMLAAPQPAAIRYPAAASLEEHLQNPYFVFMAPGQGLRSNVSGAGRNMTISPRQAEQYGTSPGYVYQHEWGHAMAPMKGTLRDGNPQMDHGTLKALLLAEFPQLAKRGNVANSAAERLQHISETTEVPAYLNHLRRLHYGLTGDALLTPEDRLRFITEVAKGPKGNLGKPALRTETMFPGSPEMTHGPNAGQPAEGYEKIRQYLRLILPRLQPGQKRDVIETFNKGASTTNPNEAVYV